MTEEWRPVVGNEVFYRVSNLGRVKSLKNGRYGTVSGEGKMLRPGLSSHGYYTVCLWKDGRSRSVYVHRLVATAFIPNPDGKREVNHMDGDKTNNNISNLEWVSRRGNAIHALEVLGNRCLRGESSPSAKLTEDDVRAIRKRYRKGCPRNGVNPLAREYGMCTRAMTKVVKRMTWRHVS